MAKCAKANRFEFPIFRKFVLLSDVQGKIGLILAPINSSFGVNFQKFCRSGLLVTWQLLIFEKYEPKKRAALELRGQ